MADLLSFDFCAHLLLRLAVGRQGSGPAVCPVFRQRCAYIRVEQVAFVRAAAWVTFLRIDRLLKARDMKADHFGRSVRIYFVGSIESVLLKNGEPDGISARNWEQSWLTT